MKKILCLLIALILFVPCAFADRVSRTTAIYTTSGLIKRGDARVYRVEFIATSNGGGFNIKDAITGETASGIKTEGQEATALNGKPYDFTTLPSGALEVSTGLYLSITNAIVVITYD